jgi:hypothetical protein
LWGEGGPASRGSTRLEGVGVKALAMWWGEGGVWLVATPGRDSAGSGSSSRRAHMWGKIGEGEPLTGGAA